MPPRTQRHARHSADASLPANLSAPHGQVGCHRLRSRRGLIQRGRRSGVGRAHFFFDGHASTERSAEASVNGPGSVGIGRESRSAVVFREAHLRRTSALPGTLETIPPRYIRASDSLLGRGRPTNIGDRPQVAGRHVTTSPERPATTGDRCLLTGAGSTSQGDHAHLSALNQAAHPVGSSSATVCMGRCLPRRDERPAGALSHTAAALRTLRVIRPSGIRPAMPDDTPFFQERAGAVANFHSELAR